MPNPKSEVHGPQSAEIGIIGGSGLYGLVDLSDTLEVEVKTPWGAPSDHYMVGKLSGRRAAFLARHGRGHRIPPSQLNFRANIYGCKRLGVERLISLSAVGSLKKAHKPLDFVIPDQFYDHTKGRPSSFFSEGPGEGLVVHVSFAHPVCSEVCQVLEESCRTAGVSVKRGGTYLCIEGPQFSTLAESNLYRSWGMDVIGMTNVTEAKLAREAEICYSTAAMVTDYDCWHPGHDAVTVAEIVKVLNKNAANAARVVTEAVGRLPHERKCKCGSALAHALITDRGYITAATRDKLGLLVGKYLPGPLPEKMQGSKAKVWQI